jgi:hypothetical protein
MAWSATGEDERTQGWSIGISNNDYPCVIVSFSRPGLVGHRVIYFHFDLF